MTLKFSYLLLSIVCLSILPTNSLYADSNDKTKVFTVLHVEGEVNYRLYKKFKKNPVKKGMPIPEKSKIRIKKGGKLALRTPAGDELYFNKETFVTLTSLTTSDKERNVKLDLYLGQVKCKVKKLKSADSSFSIKTPVAVVGVRGTEFTTLVQLDGSTFVNVETGEVVVADVNGQFPTSSVTGGQTTKVKPGQTAQPIVKSTWKKQTNTSTKDAKTESKKEPEEKKEAEKQAEKEAEKEIEKETEKEVSEDTPLKIEDEFQKDDLFDEDNADFDNPEIYEEDIIEDQLEVIEDEKEEIIDQEEIREIIEESSTEKFDIQFDIKL